jgi:hypothetical protein
LWYKLWYKRRDKKSTELPSDVPNHLDEIMMKHESFVNQDGFREEIGLMSLPTESIDHAYADSLAAGLGVGLDGLAVSVKGDAGTYAWMCALPGCAEAAWWTGTGRRGERITIRAKGGARRCPSWDST